MSDITGFVTSSDKRDLNRLIIVLHGQLGAGKTTTAASASEHFPSELPTVRHKGSPKYKLTDMLFLSIDRDATVGLKERGIAVDEFDFANFQATGWKKWPLEKFLKPPTIVQTIDAALKVAQDQVLNHGKKWIVVDTPSTLDRSLSVHYSQPQFIPKTRGGEDDTRAMYGLLFIAHKRFHDCIRSLGCGVVYCTHSKNASEATMSETEKKTKLTLTTPGMPDIIPDLTGKGALAYKADCSLELAILATPALDSKGKKGLVRKAYTVVQEGREAKNRFELSLAPVEVPHLGKILAKIKA